MPNRMLIHGGCHFRFGRGVIFALVLHLITTLPAIMRICYNTHMNFSRLEQEPYSEDATILELRDIIKSKCRDEDDFATMEKIANFAQTLDKKYGRSSVQRFKLFHVLSSSTIDNERSPYFDIPGDSIENFIRNEL